MSKLSDSEVVERLARRMGWTIHNCGDWFTVMPPTKITNYGVWDTEAEAREHVIHRNSDLLTSRDAIYSSLSGLSPSEWRQLGATLQSGYASLIDSEGDLKFLLTIRPRDLAHAIASALGEPEVGKEGCK